MKSQMGFLQQVLEELGTWCGTSTTLDFKTVERRVEHEGWSFLTITLANFGKELEKALDQGFVDSSQFSGFRRTGGLPRFLSGFLCRVFDSKTGALVPYPDITCIWALRQFTLMFAKISLPCSPAREKSAIERYVDCEQEVRTADASADPDRILRFNRISTLLWADVLSSVDSDVYYGKIIPKHGPGATADKLRGNAKWNQQEWTHRLEQVFPHGEHLASSWRYFQDLEHVRLLEPGAERPVRVITVPKTLKTPRIIAVEPTCMQYMQQGLLASFEEAIGRCDTARQLIGWSSQVPNQHLACEGSRNGTLATLDLSEASDRVSNQHVRELLRNHGSLAGAVDSTRSRKADVPGHGVIRLAKYASMGSALCFPIEAMVFATIIFVGIERELRRPLTRKDIISYLGKVRVYGDDIIVPVEHVSSVIRELEDFGLRVNRSKSFWSGKFRESCGKEYYDGADVSIVRQRHVLPTHRADVSGIVGTLSTRNQLYKAGLWRSAYFLDKVLESLRIPLPYVGEQSPVLGRHSFLGIEHPTKMCPDLHVPLVKGWHVKSKLPVSRLDGYAALQKCLTLLELRQGSNLDDLQDNSTMPSGGVDHLERSGRPVAVSTTHRWGPAL